MRWLTGNTLAMMCFSPLAGKKYVKFWLLTLEGGDFIHSWTCQTECIQTITDERVNRPVVHPSNVTPWHLYSVWDRSLCHPQWFAFCLPLLFCQNDWVSTSCFHLIMVRGVASVKFTLLFILWYCVIGNSLFALSGADSLIQLLIFLYGNFLIPPWLKLHVCSGTNKHFKAPQRSNCMISCHVLSVPVPVPQVAVGEGEALKSG